MLAQFGTKLPAHVELRVVDSTADCRYLVLPSGRPAPKAWASKRSQPRDPRLDDWRRARHDARLIMASGPGAPWRRFLLAGLIVAGLILLLYWLLGDRLSGNQDMRLVYMGGFLVLLLAGLIGRSSILLSSLGRTLGQLAFWGAMILLLIGGYSYRGELRPFADRILGELDPSRPRTDDFLPTAANAIFTKADDGQFHIRAQVGGVSVSFILDTGASDVMLTPADARRLGFDPASLAYTRRYETANGTVEGAPVTLPALDVGPIHMTDVAASVSQVDSGSSLLGMSFLSRLASFQIQGSKLTLVQ